jgi:hypothetical protein
VGDNMDAIAHSARLGDGADQGGGVERTDTIPQVGYTRRVHHLASRSLALRMGYWNTDHDIEAFEGAGSEDQRFPKPMAIPICLRSLLIDFDRLRVHQEDVLLYRCLATLRQDVPLQEARADLSGGVRTIA